MGLLDQILGGVVGGAARSPFGAAIGGNKARLMMLLLPLVLRTLRSRGAATGGGLGGRMGGGMGGGGLGGGMARGRGGLGGPLGAAIAMGGLGALLQRMQQRGFGPQAQSWVASGPNEPLPAAALDDELDDQQLADIAAEAGVSPGEVREGLAELLPEVVDQLTPAGTLPGQDDMLASIDAFEQRLPRG